MSDQIDDNGTAYSNRSHHESRVGTTSACLALALCALVEHVAQDIVIAIFVHVVNADMSITKSATRPHLETSTILIAESATYRCKLSGRGYLCSRSGQKGQT